MEGFDQLYRSSVADVYAYVATLLGDRAAAEDVTAAAFERAWRKRRSFDAGRGTPRGWMFGIARHAALDELRRRKRVLATSEDTADPDALALEDGVDDAMRRATVRTALRDLEPRDRELVALKFYGELTNGELASVLHTSESNVGTRLHRAVAKLREACHVEA
jgi:RNA polymerase sigma-70 factor (ECF subfamily)